MKLIKFILTVIFSPLLLFLIVPLEVVGLYLNIENK